MDKKTCLFCKHFNFDMGSPGYSEYTPGTDAEFECRKDHWSMGNYGGVEKFRENIETAKDCKDFEADET